MKKINESHGEKPRLTIFGPECMFDLIFLTRSMGLMGIELKKNIFLFVLNENVDTLVFNPNMRRVGIGRD